MSANLIAPSPLGNRENNSFLDKLKSKQKNSSDWKKIIYYLSWSGLIFFGSVVFFKVTNYISFHFFSERLIFNFPWLAYLDIFLFIFILIDFIVINKVLSKNGLNNDKAWFWFFIGLLFMNCVWEIARHGYGNIFEFNIFLNSLIIVLIFSLLNIAGSVITKVYYWSIE